jgi:hypothetical protein
MGADFAPFVNEDQYTYRAVAPGASMDLRLSFVHTSTAVIKNIFINSRHEKNLF